MKQALSFPVTSTEALVTKRETPQRLPFLDGVRGLAALYVLLFHSLLRVTEKPDFGRLPPLLGYATNWALHGHFAVDVFIVLSGYCLMLPVARSEGGRLPGGFRSYIKRRMRRILPPYYIALLVSILLLAAGLLAHARFGYHSASDLSPWELRPGCLLSHLVMLHNLKREWVMAYDPAMWSVATEWQIYFLFPLVLLPVWRRFGNAAAITSGFIVGLLPHFLLPSPLHLVWASPWYVGLFATGMAGASLSASTRPRYSRLYQRCPWGSFAIVMSIVVCVLIGRLPDNLCADLADTPLLWATDALAGFATTCLILYLARCKTRPSGKNRSALLRLLESRPITLLGAFSYSLYLIHQPLTFRIIRLLELLHLPVTAMLLLDWCIGVPCILGLAYLFYLAFERRWLPSTNQPATSVRAAA